MRTSPAKKPEQLKILLNNLPNTNTKQLFDKIKSLTKQSTDISSIQKSISQTLCLLLGMSVAVSVIPLKQLPESQSLSNARHLHQYQQPKIVLEDGSYHYRIWVAPGPNFRSLDQFRKPVDKDLKVISVGAQDYESA